MIDVEKLNKEVYTFLKSHTVDGKLNFVRRPIPGVYGVFSCSPSDLQLLLKTLFEMQVGLSLDKNGVVVDNRTRSAWLNFSKESAGDGVVGCSANITSIYHPNSDFCIAWISQITVTRGF